METSMVYRKEDLETSIISRNTKEFLGDRLGYEKVKPYRRLLTIDSAGPVLVRCFMDKKHRGS